MGIKDRLFNGFQNWNGGYDGWLKWCDTLYEPDAYYNIPGPHGQVRLTLQQYKDAMGQLFQHFTMELGAFENLITKGDWCAIRYNVKIRNLDTGDEVIVRNYWEDITYRVIDRKIVAEDEVDDLLIQTDRQLLTLVTCIRGEDGFDRFLVICEKQ